MRTEQNIADNSGKIFIKGEAGRRIQCDMVEITVNFKVEDRTTARSSEKVMAQSEQFLKELQALGINMEDVILENDSIGDCFGDDEFMTSSREIKIVSEVNTKLLNKIIMLLQSYQWDARICTSYDYRNKQAVREELLEEAVKNANKKAELLANAVGKKIAGVYSIDMDNHYFRDTDVADCYLCMEAQGDYSEPLLSDDLSSPFTEMSEQVDIIYLLE